MKLQNRIQCFSTDQKKKEVHQIILLNISDQFWSVNTVLITLFGGGLKIYTTLDADLQEYADSLLNRELIKFENKNDYEVKYTDLPADTVNIVTNYVQGGVFSIEPETGYVRVLVGGRNFNHSKLNRMMQSNRQPGSGFLKPIIVHHSIG